jgi:hypothetical protein
MAINETKINEKEEFLYYDFNFNCIFKSRNTFGGGVAFIVNKNINFILINNLDKFNSECLCIKLLIEDREIHLIFYYNPPSSAVNIEMLEYIEKNFNYYIICGDLNSKNQAFGCKVNNENGINLNKFMIESNSILLNDFEPTFYRDYAEYSEILDLFLCSNNLFNKINDCRVFRL